MSNSNHLKLQPSIGPVLGVLLKDLGCKTNLGLIFCIFPFRLLTIAWLESQGFYVIFTKEEAEDAALRVQREQP